MTGKRDREDKIDVTADGWRQLGWNGIRMRVPENWDPARIADRYLLLENPVGLVMELKWDQIKESFNPRYHQRGLSSVFKKDGIEMDMHWRLPPAWSKRLSDFEHSGFQWRSEIFSGKGVILFCSECRRVCLLQFYEKNEPESSGSAETKTFEKVLQSFSDHDPDRQRLWSLYDFRILTPESFSLSSFRFSPGAFCLRFDTGRETVTFHRWSPGSVILARHGSLEAFAEKVLSMPKAAVVTHHRHESEMVVDLHGKPPSGRVERWRGRILRKPLYRRARLWYLAGQNRILGVEVESKKVIDRDFLEKICESYGLV